ncbi:MAG: carboxypeptidase-like regulatory domain-containing protein [Planctomycetaceae bacterium]
MTDKAARTFTCTVIDPDGKPVKGAMLLLSGADHYREFDRGETPTTDADGFVQVPKVFGGPLEFTIFSLDWAPVTMKVSIPQTSPLTVALQKGKRVEFRAVDLQGKPIEGIRFYPEAPQVTALASHQKRLVPFGLDFLTHRDVLNVKTNAEGVFVWENAPEMKLGYQITSSQYLTQPGGEYGPEGSPHTLVFRPVIPVSITLLDAANGSLVSDARIMEGTHFKSNPAGRWEWHWKSEPSTSEGQFETNLRALNRVIQFRVQATGYRPALSQEFDPSALPDSPITLQIRLEADAGFSGTAFQPDGRPAAGAKIYTKSESKPDISKNLYIKNGVVDESQITSATTADPSGNFQILPHAEPFECLIVHDTGYLKLMDVELLQQSELKLLPWASVKGELWMRGTPAANVGVHLLMRDEFLDDESSLPHIGFSQSVHTDASGMFAFPKCIAGDWERIMPYYDSVTEIRSEMHHDFIRLEPGEERHEIIGRDGADVVGRVTLPPDLEIVMNKCDIWVVNVDARRNGSVNHVTLLPDGSFRCSNLPVAKHEIRILVSVAGEQFPPVRYTQKIVITPERFVGKSSTDPIDLGEIQVEPIE